MLSSEISTLLGLLWVLHDRIFNWFVLWVLCQTVLPLTADGALWFLIRVHRPFQHNVRTHFYYNDVIMDAMVFHITSLTIAYSTIFRHRSKKTSKLCVTGLYEANSPVIGEFPAQLTSNAENISIWCRHHVYLCLSEVSEGNCHIYNVFSHWVRPCSTIDKNWNQKWALLTKFYVESLQL